VFRILFLFLLLLSSPLRSSEGKWINPFTDVCWECVFPFTVSGVNVSGGYSDYTTYNQALCFCGGFPPKAGIPLSFWSPEILIDVTRHAYKLLGLGGMSIGSANVRNRGAVSVTSSGSSENSFYHVHYYKFPLLSILGLFTDFECIESEEVDIGYMSELDPLWNDDQLSFILNAEAALFSQSAAQIACAADCTLSTMDKPNDKLFWCAGCLGSLYPFTGSVAHHQGGIQASSLLVHRLLAKMHRSYFLKGYENKNFCEAKFMPVIKKTLYKTQLAYPRAQTKGPCNALGKSTVMWGAGKSYPKGGEDFVYLVWRKKQCCLDAVSKAIGAQ
tara:strand:+ start:2419 stop:3408 length:990 start_codon:yes stop_codon:yes gene_type:complete